MTIEKIQMLAEKTMQQANQDKKTCLQRLAFALDSFLSLGQYKKADQVGRVLAFVRRYY